MDGCGWVCVCVCVCVCVGGWVGVSASPIHTYSMSVICSEHVLYILVMLFTISDKDIILCWFHIWTLTRIVIKITYS